MKKRIPLLILLGAIAMSGCGSNNKSNSKKEDENIVIEANVDDVTSAIDGIENVDSDSGKLIDAISLAFNKLTLEEKNQVTNYEKLFEIQKEYATLNGPVESEFDEENIVHRFGALSDVHGGDNLPNVLNILSNWGGEGMDALILAGDLTDGVRYYNTESWEIEKIRNNILNYVDENLPIVMTLGNHDTSDGSNTALFYDGLGPRFYSGISDLDAARNKGTGHAFVNGYHFITLECNYADVAHEGLTKDSEVFLEKTMREITTSPDYDGKYIFIVTHLIPYNTLGDSSNSTKINDILKFYPQAFVIAGHTHTTIADERNIMQTRFTTMNPGSASWLFAGHGFLETESSGVIKSQYNEYNSYDLPQGALLELDVNGNIRINRIDFRGDGYLIRTPWEVNAPKVNNSHLFSYTKDRLLNENNEAPYFDEDMKAYITYSENKSRFDCELVFDAATDDDQFVYYYDVKLMNSSNQTLASFKTLSEFYVYADTDMMPSSKRCLCNGLSSLPNKIIIKAVDIFLKESEEKVLQVNCMPK